jgi:protein kinase A
VMLCKGHNMMADYWSLGVFIYEMLAGYAPFESRNESERYYKILNAKLKFPPDFDPQAAALIKQLCVVEPSKRLGCSLEGVNEIRRQPFFETIDWVELDNPPARRTPGPHVAPNNPTRNAAKAEALQKLKVCLPPHLG